MIRYVFQLDVDGTGGPEYRVVVSNADRRIPGYTGALVDVRTRRRVPGRFPGVARIEAASVFVQLRRTAIGYPRRIGLAAAVDRTFYLDRTTVPPTTTSSRDAVPDRQWPRPEPVWVVVGSVR